MQCSGPSIFVETACLDQRTAGPKVVGNGICRRRSVAKNLLDQLRHVAGFVGMAAANRYTIRATTEVALITMDHTHVGRIIVWRVGR